MQPKPAPYTDWYVSAMERLLNVIQDLSCARSLDTVMQIVRTAARELTGADGATFVLRDDDKCYYADEDAVTPLWKGQRFPMNSCISGWVMLNGKPALIEDIYKDPRIPANAYRPTFVKSLAMVPIRKDDPIGAIGNYWAVQRMPTGEECAILEALAAATSVSMENISLYTQLQEKIGELEQSGTELARFVEIASHDLKEPLRGIYSYAQYVREDYKDHLGAAGEEKLHNLQQLAVRLEGLVDALAYYAKISMEPLILAETDMNSAVRQALAALNLPDDRKDVTVTIQEDLPTVLCDRARAVEIFYNLISNALIYNESSIKEIRIGYRDNGGEGPGRGVFFVADNGAGIPERHAESVFWMFKRLRGSEKGGGNGIGAGLTIAKKIIHRHGGEIWIGSGESEGTTFYFTLSHG